MEKKHLLLIISAIAIAVFLVTFYFNVYDISKTTDTQYNRTKPEFPTPPFPMPIPIEHRIWLSPLVLIIAIIPISYYFISKKMEKNMKVVLNLINKNKTHTKNDSPGIDNKHAILKLLNFNERKVIERLIERKGEILQSEISHISGMDKLKAHRAIRNLKLKGVIEIEGHGKTNRIILSKDIKDIMLG